MKTFIFLLLIISYFFYYLFFEKSSTYTNYNQNSLEDIEKQNNIDTDHEVKEYANLSKEAPSAIPEEQTFDTIKNILKEVSGRIHTSNITLNTRVTTYLYTLNKREEFKQKIASAFNLSYDKVDKMFQKNKLVWDWVNELKE
jgi:regulatory protein YycI of two-component signal transduction system YycFG